MSVVDLSKYMSRDTAELLEGLLAVVYEDGGSLALAYRSPRGDERIAFTGAYARDSQLALKTILLMSKHLTMMEDQVRGRP